MSRNSKTLVQHEPTINEETLSRIPIPSEAQIFTTRTRQHALKEPCLSSLFSHVTGQNETISPNTYYYDTWRVNNIAVALLS